MKLSDFDYDLPRGRIAQAPTEERGQSRLLHLHPHTGATSHLKFLDLRRLLHAGDVLVLNDTRVFPARISGSRRATGGKVDALLVRREEGASWQALLSARGRLQPGETLDFAGGACSAVILERHPDEGWRLQFRVPADELWQVLELHGRMPLPPYIKRAGEEDARLDADRTRYQTVFAREVGAIAAPTAGLHFSEAFLNELEGMGVVLTWVTLHVGLGTFKPVTAEDPTKHQMHAEFYRLPAESVQVVNSAKEEGRRVIAVGTTACRTLESCGPTGRLEPGEGWTDLFIYPPHEFRIIDGLLTNFHLPRSTLLMLVSALAGRENILAAYRAAVDHQYRFFSYGDAMIILP